MELKPSTLLTNPWTMVMVMAMVEVQAMEVTMEKDTKNTDRGLTEKVAPRRVTTIAAREITATTVNMKANITERVVTVATVGLMAV